MVHDHPYIGELRSGASCQFVYADPDAKGEQHPTICALQAMQHAVTPALNTLVAEEESFRIRDAYRPNIEGLRRTSPEAEALEEAHNRPIPMPPTGAALVRAADAAQYARPAIPAEQRGQIRVRLLNATPDPLGSVAALIAQYSGRVVRSLSEVTDEERRSALADMSKTVLSGPLEAVQFHWQIEGVTRSITHQMVRSRASFFAQESLRFAVPEGNWANEIPLPPSLAGAREEQRKYQESFVLSDPGASPKVLMLDQWEDAMINAQNAYRRLIDLGMPAEEARGILPHDMPTRIHWICDLRTLLAEAGKRTCTQAQFPWRLIFAGMAQELRNYGGRADVRARSQGQGMRALPADGWQFREIANRLRPVCFQTGKCGFMAQFDRSCSIRERVDAFAAAGVPSSRWGENYETGRKGFIPDPLPWATRDGSREVIPAIRDWEWAADPGAARS